MKLLADNLSGRTFRILMFPLLILTFAALFLACTEKPRFFFDFEADKDLDDLVWKCKTLFRISDQHATSWSRSLKVLLYPDPDNTGEHYPGIGFNRFNPDWSSYSSLCFDAFNPEEKALSLVVRIDDCKNPDFPDRYNKAIILVPGANHVSLPLNSLITSGTKKRLNLARIEGVMLFLSNPKERHTIFLDRVLVE